MSSEKIHKINKKTIVSEWPFNKAAILQHAALLKTRLQRKWFPVNFSKFFRATSLWTTSRRKLLSFVIFAELLRSSVKKIEPISPSCKKIYESL